MDASSQGSSEKRKLLKIDANQKYLDVVWQVSNFCNFRCSYCNPGNYSGTDRNDDNLEVYIKNLTLITNKYLRLGYRNFKFFFSGGEPTLWRNLIPICEWIRNNLPNTVIAVNTNFSRPLSWWKKNGHLFDDVVASFHVEFSDPDKYIDNARYMCDKLNYFSCKMLMHEERFWEVVEFGERLKSELPNYFVEWTPLFDELSMNAGPWQYTDPEKAKFLQEHTADQKKTVDTPYLKNPFYSQAFWSDGEVTSAYSNAIIVERQNFFKGWECHIGDNVWINQVGQVSMGTCGQVEKLGNILSDVKQVGPKKIICGKEHCMCGTDILIPKFPIKVVKG
jgi:organic radical activating enzyme